MKPSVRIPEWLTGRKVFIFLSAAIFIILPLLAIDAGISGDEPVHYQHAEFVNNYFATNGEDRSAVETPKTHLKYYGQLIDNISFWINDLLNSSNPYLTRHILNALLGAIMILFTALLAVKLASWKAGILAIIFMFLSPRILGHSYNNLKDIPFALGYIMAIYGLVVLIMKYPRVRAWPFIWMTLGLALAFGTRAGGLILIPISFFFVFLKWLTHQPLDELKKIQCWKNGLIFLFVLLGASLAGFFIGILAWPYALQAPFRHSLESLSVMTHYSISIRQLFEGQWLWSEHLPAYYPLKYILITSPLVIITGILFQFLRFKKSFILILSLLNFALFFPLLWIMIKGSNLYGGWRHLLFVYPVLVVLSSISWEAVSGWGKSSFMKIAAAGIIIAGLAGPLVHIIKYHPVEYVYFNKLCGGVEGAFAKYETDYYYHSIGPASGWLREYVNNHDKGKEIIVASNFPVEPYYTHDENISTVYTHYLSRSRYDWDYGIFVNTFLGPDYLDSRNWPPDNSLYTFNIEDKVICSVVKRPSKDDLEGISLYRKSEFPAAVEMLRSAISKEPKNESARLYLAWAYRQMNEINKSDSVVLELYRQQPGNDMAADLLGRNQIAQGQYQDALKIFRSILDKNYKYLPAYEQSAIAADSLGDYKQAAQLLERGYQLGLKDKNTIEKLVDYLQLAEYHTKAQKFRTILNKN